MVHREKTGAMRGSASSQPNYQPPALQSPRGAISNSRLNPGLLGHDGNTKGCSSVSSTPLFGLCRSLGLARFPAELSNSGHRDGAALPLKTSPLRYLKSQDTQIARLSGKLQPSYPTRLLRWKLVEQARYNCTRPALRWPLGKAKSWFCVTVPSPPTSARSLPGESDFADAALVGLLPGVGADVARQLASPLDHLLADGALLECFCPDLLLHLLGPGRIDVALV